MFIRLWILSIIVVGFKDGNEYKIPAYPWIPDLLGVDSGLGLCPQTQWVFYNGSENLITELANPLTCGPYHPCI